MIEDASKRFDAVYGSVGRAKLVQDAWAEAYGDDYPQDVEPYSFVTSSELTTIAEGLRVGPAERFVDLGCGRGGPGLWVARATGASLIGIDFSAEAVRQATARADSFGVGAHSEFRVADIKATGLGSSDVDAVMSVDVVQIPAGRAETFAEVARILRPGGRFCFTTWDITPEAPPDGVRAGRERIEDNRPLLDAAGFTVMSYDEPDRWRERMRAAYQGVIAREGDLREAFGDDATVIDEAREVSPKLQFLQRVLCVAEKR